MENIKKNADGTAELLATDQSFLNKVREEAALAARELLDAAGLKAGDILVVGCSTSEVAGHMIGKASIPVVAEALLAGLFPAVRERGVYLAAAVILAIMIPLLFPTVMAMKKEFVTDPDATAKNLQK